MANLLTVGYGTGVAISTQKGRLTAVAAHSKGDLVALDMSLVDATTGLPYKTKATLTATFDTDIFAIALEDVAIGSEGLFAFSGVVDALVDGGMGTVGAFLGPKTAAADMVTAAAGTKILAHQLEIYSATALSKVWFDGISGMGTPL